MNITTQFYPQRVRGIDGATIHEQTIDPNAKNSIICEIGSFCRGKTLYTMDSNDKAELKLAFDELKKQTRSFCRTKVTASEIYGAILVFRHFKRNVPNELQAVVDFLSENFDIDVGSSHGSSSRIDFSNEYFQQLRNYLHDPFPGNDWNNSWSKQRYSFRSMIEAFGAVPTLDQIAQTNCKVLDVKFKRFRDSLFSKKGFYDEDRFIGNSDFQKEYLKLLQAHKGDLTRCKMTVIDFDSNTKFYSSDSTFYDFKDVLMDASWPLWGTDKFNALYELSASYDLSILYPKDANRVLKKMSKYEFYVCELIERLIIHFQECGYTNFASPRHISDLIESAVGGIERSDVVNDIFLVMVQRLGDRSRPELSQLLRPKQ